MAAILCRPQSVKCSSASTSWITRLPWNSLVGTIRKVLPPRRLSNRRAIGQFCNKILRLLTLWHIKIRWLIGYQNGPCFKLARVVRCWTFTMDTKYWVKLDECRSLRHCVQQMNWYLMHRPQCVRYDKGQKEDFLTSCQRDVELILIPLKPFETLGVHLCTMMLKHSKVLF